MKKYLWVARNTWEEVLTYRFNFLMWRVRNIVFLLSIYFLWYSVIPEGTNLFGYDQSSILTYILGTALIAAFVLSNRSYAIGDEINQGNLSNYLLRPMNYFAYWFSKDIGDKLMNIIFSVAELFVIYLFLKPPIYIQTDLKVIIFFIISIIFAIILYFFMNVLLGLIGFWSPDVWAPRFIFWIAIGFFAGSYFPLDILPSLIYKFFAILPFSYLVYFPMKVYLGQLSIVEILKGFIIMISWTGALFIIVNFIWQKGLKVYTAQGR